MRLGLIFFFVTKIFKNNYLLTMIVNNDLEDSNIILKPKKKINLQKTVNNTNSFLNNSDGNHIHSENYDFIEKLNNKIIKINKYSMMINRLNSKYISNNEKIKFINENDILPIKLYDLNASGLWKDWNFEM